MKSCMENCLVFLGGWGGDCRTVLFILLNKILLLICNGIGEKTSLNNGICLLQAFFNVLIAKLEHERISMNFQNCIYNVQTKFTVLYKNKMKKECGSYFFVFPFCNRALFVLSV